MVYFVMVYSDPHHYQEAGQKKKWTSMNLKLNQVKWVNIHWAPAVSSMLLVVWAGQKSCVIPSMSLKSREQTRNKYLIT